MFGWFGKDCLLVRIDYSVIVNVFCLVSGKFYYVMFDG